MDTQTNNTGENTAPFNMAIATLERIHNLLIAISDISKRADINPASQGYLPRNFGQHQKVKLVKELYLNSFPLMQTEDANNLKEKIKSLSPVWGKDKDIYTGKRGGVPIFDLTLENNLFDLILEIETALNKNKVFMPTKRDQMF